MARFYINHSLVSAKFLLVVSTMLFGFSSVTDGFGWYNKKTEVNLMNDLSPNTTLTFRCKSADDDLGERSLAFNDAWGWSFHINFFDTTLYWCNFWWVEENGKPRQEGFQIFKAKRDFKRCHYYCRHAIRPDGVYRYKGGVPYLLYKWPSV
ncbi:hypothetical protein MKW98_013415 [Papaver atlanticum]|uniref:S-protein homolog n=1 Tax=Papaver atlanticum TaxID=357466 RepID=A0AAD4SSQ9_9MAGN|nr:hypothetical protein MKW98_013415 [Papaver atlanticum]